MIFRLTLKLAKKLGLGPLPALSSDKNRNPLLDWHAHVFTAQRLQYIILTNTASLYSLVMPGRGIANDRQFVRGARSCMKELLDIDVAETLFAETIEPATEDGKALFSKSTDRRVAGSMNDLIFQAKFYLAEGYKSPHDTAILINESPMSYLNYDKPREAFRKLCFGKDVPFGNGTMKSNVIHVDFHRQSAPRK
jgi:hypothetical protein